jgi:hypothetical protein
MRYVGIDWAYRRAAWCAKQAVGTIFGEGFVPADEDGLARLVIELGPGVRACLEMMSGAVWVRDRLVGAGWQVEVADARKVKNVAPLACKTDKVDARVLAELCRRELVPAHALGLALIAAVYIGFAVADGRPKVIVVESTVASIFVVVAAVAVTGSLWLIVVGLVGRGLKDLWQHRRQFVANTGGGRRFAWSSTGLPRQSSPSRSSPE